MQTKNTVVEPPVNSNDEKKPANGSVLFQLIAAVVGMK